MENGAENEEPVAYVVTRGWLADFILRLTRPVVAWPGQELYRVVLHGHGFVHSVAGLPPRIGFYTTYFVAARDVRSAEGKAVQRLRERWDTFYSDEATGDLVIDVEESERLPQRFLRRSRWGLAFYRNDD
ncbi:MAG TPA: hypothetical protein VF432_15920 [Thermoanaerobaculia bacterium]